MTDFIIYLVKVNVCIAAFYLIYLVLLRTTTFFRSNRFYLLTCLIISFAIPLIELPIDPIVYQDQISILPDYTEGYFPSPVIPGTIEPVFHFEFLINIVYVSGAVVLMLFALISIIRVRRIFRNADVKLHMGVRLAFTPSSHPFTFFSIIFVPTQEINPMIIQHELVHIHERHWIDLLLIELATILLWFNPLIYYYRKSLVLQHEYLADNQVIIENTLETYLRCLGRQLHHQTVPQFTNHFSSSSIKQRIIMMTTEKKYSTIRYFAIIPVLCLLLTGFSSSKQIHKAALPGVGVFQDGPFGIPVVPSDTKVEGGGFGERIHPITRKKQFHTGIDLIAPAGRTISSTMDGVVAKAQFEGAWGNIVVIKHDDTWSTSYSHMNDINVKEGASVKKGDKIGTIGSTGQSVGPHLHYEILKDGKAVDPAPFIR